MPGWMKWGVSLLVGMGLIVLGWRVPFLLATVYVLVCFLLVVVVLLQSGKAADLAGAFGGAGSQTAFGPRGAATFLSKATTWCAIMFMLTSMALVLKKDTTRAAGGSIFENRGKPAPTAPPSSTPTPQTQPPAQTPPQQQPPAQQPPTQTPQPQKPPAKQ